MSNIGSSPRTRIASRSKYADNDICNWDRNDEAQWERWNYTKRSSSKVKQLFGVAFPKEKMPDDLSPTPRKSPISWRLELRQGIDDYNKHFNDNNSSHDSDDQPPAAVVTSRITSCESVAKINSPRKRKQVKYYVTDDDRYNTTYRSFPSKRNSDVKIRDEKSKLDQQMQQLRQKKEEYLRESLMASNNIHQPFKKTKANHSGDYEKRHSSDKRRISRHRSKQRSIVDMYASKNVDPNHVKEFFKQLSKHDRRGENKHRRDHSKYVSHKEKRLKSGNDFLIEGTRFKKRRSRSLDSKVHYRNKEPIQQPPIANGINFSKALQHIR